jgi:uroporphyrinogen-III decarboxylase
VIQQAEELLDDGARFIWIGEGSASGSLIPPEFYREFVLPYEKSLTSTIRARGGLSILHICGNATALLADICESGADGFDLDYPVDLAYALATLSPRVAVKGNINPVLFLAGNEEDLKEAAHRAVDTGKGNLGFIMSTGCLVPRDSSIKAFDIFAKACGI